MSGFSSSAYLLWAILACLFESFLFVHLYSYDKFQCLKWGSGRQPGAFKRVMTYSYLATVPLLMVFALGMTVLSYGQAVVVLPDGKVLALPFIAWTHSARKFLLPLFFVLAAGWALELVTHLEELTFWLFLLHQGPHKRDWFKSCEFRVWYIGSVIAILGMPLTVIIKRSDLDLCFVWIFIAGSAAGLATTLCFIYVLARFPGFIRRVKSEGAEPEVVMRLTIFYQLNIIRIIFRFLFHFPLLILALDAVRGGHDIVNNGAASDLLCMLGGIGCVVSSAITLFVFFPRSITRENGYRVKISSSANTERASSLPEYNQDDAELDLDAYTREQEYEGEATPQYESDPESNFDSPTLHGRVWVADSNNGSMTWEMQSDAPVHPVRSHHHRHRSRSRRHETEEQTSIETIRAGSRKDKRPNSGVIVIPHIPRVPPPPTAEDPSASRRSSVMHPYAMNFTSPIDLCDPDEDLQSQTI
ncbi:hypothetical protein BDP27DRAFT_1315132 [Rhodocollybia butyracea]|uniref:Transmembrane protein n=1 Tax=Rhodocollybia butyracea TaxID=206335 RepID=A0A9P5Q5K9_9AGAR|nr:hypothetical protein BDP27DRAFT_1315132 [Rhodocollybia butyracea]